MKISSAFHLAPDEVARHTFATARRGFAPDEVRAYLESIAKGLRALADREHEFRRELEEAESRVAHPVVNEETLTAALGQETARVLHSAHEASSEMLAKAEAEAVRLLTDARQEIADTEDRVSAQLSGRAAEAEAAAAECWQRAQEDAAAALEAARTEVEALIDQARSECHDMINEAQALRARVLADLSKRRKVLHAQIEQLRAGRENLASTVRSVRRSIDTIADDLFRAEDEARLAAEAAGRVAVARPDEGTPEELAASLLAEEALVAEALVTGQTFDAQPDADEDHGQATDELHDLTDQTDQTNQTDLSPEPVDGVGAHGEIGNAAEMDFPGPIPSVDALFAKIRASREEGDAGVEDPAGVVATVDNEPSVPPIPVPVDDVSHSPEVSDAGVPEIEAAYESEEEDEGDAPPEERNPFTVRRDEMIAPLVKALARRMKRTLQDDQNDLLDRLRSRHFQWSPDILPAEPEHSDSYSTAALPHLVEAAQAGASFVGSEGTAGPLTEEMTTVAHDLAETVLAPLRRRLSEGEHLHGADEPVVAEQVGSAFREWKGERIERLAGDYVVAAFSVGSLAGSKRKKNLRVEWIAAAAAGDEPCPDCGDNMLNGPQRPGGEFPTGHVHPPAHPGCRCLLAPSAT